MKKKLGLKKGDVLIFSVLSVICILLFLVPLFKGGGDTVATVWLEGKKEKEINLSAVTEDYEIKINHCVLSVGKGKIGFLSSDCPDKLCVKSGFLSKNGDTAACLPNKVVVKLENRKERLDAVAY